MGYAYISSCLAPGQALLQYMGFHELVALLKFNQCVFEQANRAQHTALLYTARKLRRQAAARQPRPMTTPRVSRAADAAVQWWQTSRGRHWPAAPGHAPQVPQLPQVGIVSTVETLAGALSLGNHDLYISEVAGQRTATADIAVFSLLDDGLPHTSGSELRVLVDVRELITGIVLPDDAPPRFLELVRTVVQEHLWIPVDTLTRSSLTQDCLDPGIAMFRIMAK